MSTTPDEDVDTSGGESRAVTRHRRVLRRPAKGRMLAGVAAGIASYSGVDVSIVRVGFAVLTIVGFTGIPFVTLPLYLLGIPLYLACWLFIPEEGSDQAIAATMLHKLHSRPR